MIAEPKTEKTLARIATALETSFVFKGIEQNVLQQVSLSWTHPATLTLSTFKLIESWVLAGQVELSYMVCLSMLSSSYIVSNFPNGQAF